jgi:anti-sigma factor RsiW
MKCEVSLRLLEESVDGELAGHEAGQISSHLSVCSLCASELAALTAEQELLGRYDSDIHVPTSMWEAVSVRTILTSEEHASHDFFRARFANLFRNRLTRFSFAGATALVLVAVIVGVAYMSRLNRRSPRNQITQSQVNDRFIPNSIVPKPQVGALEQPGPVRNNSAVPATSRHAKHFASRTPARSNQPDVLSSQFAYADLADRDTAKHLEQSQNLLRSVRNFPVPDNDDEIDISYDKALSRRLLSENVILRREAEMRANLPARMLLSDLEPFLLDIANLPDQPTAGELRIIKERVKKTEIVAALLSY